MWASAVATVVKSRNVLSGHLGYGICVLENDKSEERRRNVHIRKYPPWVPNK